MALVAGASDGRHSTRLPISVSQRNPAGHAKLTVPLERLKANGVTINAGPLLVIPPAIHSFYFFDPNGIRLEITSDLDGDEEDLQVIRSCSMTETELRAELETISSDRAWIDEMVAAMTPDELGSRDTPPPSR